MGMNSGSAGVTSEGKFMTEGLEYSSSALDMASAANIQTQSNIQSARKSSAEAPESSQFEPVTQFRPITDPLAADDEARRQHQVQQQDFKFQHSPVGNAGTGTFGGNSHQVSTNLNGGDPHDFFHAQNVHETSHLVMSGGAASSHYLNQSSLSGSEQPIYKEVSLKFSNKFGGASDS